MLLLIIIHLFKYTIEQDELYYYNLGDVYEYLNLNTLEENEYNSIINSISNIFLNSYAFNEISKNPPQPFFSNNYHQKIDIQEKLEKIDTSIPNLNKYDFYLKIMEVLYELKDLHIKLNFIEDGFEKFSLVSPFIYIIKYDENNRPEFYIEKCIEENIIKDYFDNCKDILDFCDNKVGSSDFQVKVKYINDENPFDYFLKLGKMSQTKNIHGSFSYIMQDTNYLKLNMIFFNFLDDNYKKIKIEFDDDDNTIINTQYIIESEINIYEDDEDEDEEDNFLLFKNKKIKTNNNNNNNILSLSSTYFNNYYNNKEINKKKILSTKLGEYYVNWQNRYEEGGEDLFKCCVDNDNNVNVYYIHSFEATEVDRYIDKIIKCVELFDENSNPIIVINDRNSGGVVKLSQFFLGVLSPLMSINLFKGRFRLTNNFINTKEVSDYISSNFTNIYNCSSASYDYLIKGQKNINYTKEENLSEIFYLTNSSLQEEIEKIRAKMKNKRKPTEIIVLTDGYSFSAASLYIKYLQKQGGALVIGYSGDIYNESTFDSSQSPSPIFPFNILNLFNKDNIEILSNYGIELEFAGIQSFYDKNDINVPLEYEVTPVDDRLKFFLNYNGNDDNYPTIIEQSKQILDKLNNKCYKDNKKIVNITEACDGKFGNKYTHGGYLCSDEGVWTKDCVPVYCDMGFIFDEKNKICVKDVCSSMPTSKDEYEEENEMEEKEEKELEDEGNNNEEEKEEPEDEINEKENKEEKEEDETDNEKENEYEKQDNIKEEKEENENEMEKEKEDEIIIINEEKKERAKEEETKKEDKIEAYVIVLIVVGSVFLIISIILIIHYYRKRHIKNEIDSKKDITKIAFPNSSEAMT